MKILTVFSMLVCAVVVFFSDATEIKNSIFNLMWMGAAGIVLYGIFQVVKDSILCKEDKE